LLSLPQMWKRRCLVIPFFALASFSTLLGSWRVRVFKVESAVAGKGEVKAGMKILRSSSASTGHRPCCCGVKTGWKVVYVGILPWLIT
jgi:hypothetical protein